MNQERLLKIVLAPHTSEKSALSVEKNNTYVFRVLANATKPEIKDAVEHLFNTKVKSVRVVNVRSKSKTFKGFEGRRSAWKKAYVVLQSDQKIELFGAQ